MSKSVETKRKSCLNGVRKINLKKIVKMFDIVRDLHYNRQHYMFKFTT